MVAGRADQADTPAPARGTPAASPVFPRNARARPPGFTILEMVVVMGIMIVMLGVASFAIRAEAADPSVRKPADELIRLAKTAVRGSAVQGRSFSVAFEKSGISLLGAEGGQRSQVTLPKGMKVFVKRWGARSWEPAAGHRWWFGMQGLCEPISVRLAAADSVIEIKFNPLTGTPAEELIEVF